MGELNLGDTSASLATMPTSKKLRRRSDARVEALQQMANSDSAIFKKFVIAFVELTSRQTWIWPGLVLFVAYGLFFVSGKDTVTYRFLESLIVPSYHIAGTDQYGKGRNDFYFVGFYAIVFTFFREFLMCTVLRPLAYFLGVRRESKAKRFMEQTYAMVYCGILGPLGLWIMLQLPLWYFDTTQFYVSYPHKTHDIFFKVYYLGQASFWVQQLVVLILQLEKPRKDFKELVLHHIITIALIWCSYRFHFTWMGIAVYVTMDVSDFFLALSKTINYVNPDLIFTGPSLVVFVFVWVYLRHYQNLRILWSVLTEFRLVGPWEVNWVTQQYKCYISQPIVFGLIGALQIVNAYWLFLILRIVWRYVIGGGAQDDRSDDESEDEDDKKNQ